MFIEIKDDCFGYKRFINTNYITNIKPCIVVNANDNPPYQSLDGYIICLADNTQIRISIEQYKNLVLELGEKC